MRSVGLIVVFLSTTAVLPVRGEEQRAADQDLFTSRVRPILARHCFKCHGPDDKARKAKLRWTCATEAVKPAASGAIPIVPGKPDESELVSRIFADDASEQMPPPAAKLPLSAVDKQVLKQWIDEGAEYKTHWAFIPPHAGTPPRGSAERAGRGTRIDAFILARLEAAGLQPSEQADRATLIRRLSLDLIGLPPTPARGRGVRARPAPGCLRESRRPAAGIAALWRALGQAMARPGPLCRH